VIGLERHFSRIGRRAGGALLLAILAACAYAGSAPQAVQTVSVAVARTKVEEQEWKTGSAQSARESLRAEREKEIAMLKDVAQSDMADAKTKADALSQITQIVRRIETQAQTEAYLEEAGFENCAVFSGEHVLHVVTPYENVADEADKNRLLDAVCSLAGCDVSDIKIILTKN
jgi:hypothetical protein